MVIWKQQLVLAHKQDFEAPEGAVILSVGAQGGALVLWYECDPTRPLVPRHLLIVGTGNEYEVSGGTLSYLGTVQLHLSFVAHIFEVTAP